MTPKLLEVPISTCLRGEPNVLSFVNALMPVWTSLSALFMLLMHAHVMVVKSQKINKMSQNFEITKTRTKIDS